MDIDNDDDNSVISSLIDSSCSSSSDENNYDCESIQSLNEHITNDNTAIKLQKLILLLPYCK